MDILSKDGCGPATGLVTGPLSRNAEHAGSDEGG